MFVFSSFGIIKIPLQKGIGTNVPQTYMNSVGAIIVAAGKSIRMEGIDKLDLVYDKKTVLEHVLLRFLEHKDISEVVLVVSKDKRKHVEDLVYSLINDKPIKIVEGGVSRLQSVKNGVEAVDKKNEYILIQDAARPFTDDDLITRTIDAASIYGAAVGGIAVTDTIKIVDEDGFVASTLDRSTLKAVGTPQVFRAQTFIDALSVYEYDTAYDDCQIIESIGIPVKVIEGQQSNIKITERKDVMFMMKEDLRIGHGYDVHRLIEGEFVILAGVKIPNNYSLLGHSDADVVVHAIIDALLGAAVLGDIGKIFPNTDEQYKGISSILLLEKTTELLKREGFYIKNIDATVICERPKLTNYISPMRMNIAKATELEFDRVSIKATTEEGLGFTGNDEGIIAHAVTLVYRPIGG